MGSGLMWPPWQVQLSLNWWLFFYLFFLQVAKLQSMLVNICTDTSLKIQILVMVICQMQLKRQETISKFLKYDVVTPHGLRQCCICWIQLQGRVGWQSVLGELSYTVEHETGNISKHTSCNVESEQKIYNIIQPFHLLFISNKLKVTKCQMVF